ncbi:MAG: hypothetical protein ACE361_05675 [Aureliella sp.]
MKEFENSQTVNPAIPSTLLAGLADVDVKAAVRQSKDQLRCSLQGGSRIAATQPARHLPKILDERTA